MLTILKIRNLALVDELTWELGEGLVGVTGETGAGKSIIVGALKLLLGERADRTLIRSGTDSCTIEAAFRLPNLEEVSGFLEERGFDPLEGDELVLKRSFAASGTNKQYINCSPATLAVLKELGHLLVDLHGPHDHQSLFAPDRQMAMLDAYAHAEDLLERYREAYAAWREAQRELEEVRDAERAGEQELDLLRFQVNEIESAGFAAGDEQELEHRYRLASNASRIRNSCNQILEHLSSGASPILDRLAETQKAAHELERLDPQVTPLIQGLGVARLELEELARGVAGYAEGIEFDAAAVAELERRVDQLEGLKRKYGSTIKDILDFGTEVRRKLKRNEGSDDELERLASEEASAREVVMRAGRRLGDARRKAAPKLSREIASHLGNLGFLRSKFDVQLSAEPAPGARGTETVEFLFAPNPGEPPKPLRVIASSGEMSRVMLAIKSALAEQESIPLMVFDEIDANVGGEIAHAVGAEMASLGERHQVVAITHLPQVAAVAHCHYVVCKEVEGGKTRSLLRRVDGRERVEEIARMLGGGGKPELALAGNLLAERASQ